MRIGEFAEKNHISIDTVRYYMELKLIIPERHGGQYSFDQRCQKDIEELLWLKSADFSLNQIQRIFSLKRMTSLKTSEDIEFYRQIFIEKKQELLDKRSLLDQIINNIDIKILEVQQDPSPNDIKLGVPLDFLQAIICPGCLKKMKLVKGNIEDGLIINGELSANCSCMYGKLKIQNGIIVNEAQVISEKHSEDDLQGHYIDQTSADYINLVYKSGQWISNKLNLSSLHNAIILEPGTGSGIFLNAVLKEINNDCTYICVDHNYELLKSTKVTIEKRHTAANIIFICCDFRSIPIADGMIDILLDHYGTTNFNFYQEGYLMNMIDNLIKPGGIWIGDYFAFDPAAKSLEWLELKTRPYYYRRNLTEALKNSGFVNDELVEMGSTQKGGIYERFFIEGDTLYDYVYYGEKK